MEDECFNEAGARTPRKRSAINGTTGRCDAHRFNEAGARTPRKSATSFRASEAGARTKRCYADLSELQ